MIEVVTVELIGLALTLRSHLDSEGPLNTIRTYKSFSGNDLRTTVTS